MRCKYCSYEAVSIVTHRGPEGRWYAREARDPLCKLHRIRLMGYWGATSKPAPPETGRDACLRILRTAGPQSASEVAEAVAAEGGVPSSVAGALYRLWIAGKVQRRKTRGSPGRWRDRLVFTYSIPEVNSDCE